MIWKQGSFEQELFEGMQKAELQSLAKEESHDEDLIVQAMEELNAAAESFEQAGRTKRAQEVTSIMISLAKAKKEDGKSKKSKKPSSKDEAKKIFMFFGFKPEDLE